MGGVDLIADALLFEGPEEALHRCVVPHVAGSAHRADDTMIGQQPLELLAAVLAAAIGVMQQRIGLVLVC